MDKKDIVRIRSNVAGILAVLWMTVIFIFSAQDKEESSAVSGGISDRIIHTTEWLLHLNIDEETLAAIALAIERAVRKGAHMAEFAILAILLYLWIGRWEISRLRRYWIAAALAAAYACSDEFHQLFVAGRAGLISDVFVDGAGAVLGLALFVAIQGYVMKKRGSREQRAVDRRQSQM